MTITVTSHIRRAQSLAAELLDEVPERLAHSAAVARVAAAVAETVTPDERDVLIAAAWLHDIGYAPGLRFTGFHPLDGASYLLRQGWPIRLAGLVAHHSGASFTASAVGLGPDLDRYACECSAVSDALTYADQHTGPFGRSMTLEERLADMLHRHGAGSPQAEVHSRRSVYLRAAVDRVRARLAALTP